MVLSPLEIVLLATFAGVADNYFGTFLPELLRFAAVCQGWEMSTRNTVREHSFTRTAASNHLYGSDHAFPERHEVRKPRYGVAK